MVTSGPAPAVGFHVQVHGNGQLERVFQNHLDAAVSGDGHGHGFVDGLGPIGAVNGNVHPHIHGIVRVDAGGGGLAGGGQGPVGLDFLGNGPGGLGVNGAALHQAGQQIGAAVLEISAQGLVGDGSQIVPQEGGGVQHGEVEQAVEHGEVQRVCVQEVHAVLIA